MIEKPLIVISRYILALSIVALLGVSPNYCQAGGGPENLFLLVNSASRDSLTVANHYIDLRGIPPQNVFYVSWKRSLVSVRGSTFLKEVLKPAFEEIQRRKLGGQIDYLVYSCDFPWRIDFARDFPEENFPPEMKPVASLNGATYLWAFLKDLRKEAFGRNTNLYYSKIRPGIAHTRAFRSRYFWNPDGRRTSSTKGIPYFLSTMLGVTNGRGNSVEEIVRYLTSASQADGSKPAGVVYYVQNGTPRSTPRHNLFPQAVAELTLAGVPAEIVDGHFIKNKLNVMGVTCGAPLLNIAQSGCRFMPGALGDNLTSAGGNLVIRKLKGPDQTPLSEFLRFGAAGASGTIVEPRAIAQKFPSPFLHVHYAHGCSLGEAFYQSVAGPYQLLIVGDPLCQPWADIPQVSLDSIHHGARVSKQISITPSAKTSKGKAAAYFELYIDGQRLQRCELGGKFSIDTTTLADGIHELSVVATDNTPLETQGRWVGEIMVKNGRDAIQISVDQAGLVSGMKFLTVKVASSRKEPVTVLHNTRELGRVARGTGTVIIPVESLGLGPVTLRAISEGSTMLRARPLRIILP